jgi:prostaglandin-endoperoxide synthase 2
MAGGPFDDLIGNVVRTETFNSVVTFLGIERSVNRLMIKRLVGRAKPRPYPYSLYTRTAGGDLADHVCWAGLTTPRFTMRHLPPAEPDTTGWKSPEWDEVKDLFTRAAFRPSPRSSALFPFFAQWFTEGFLRTHAADKRLNTSNHEIDLSQIYGLATETTDILREPEAAGGGKLRAEPAGPADAAYPPPLYDSATGKLRDAFKDLPYVRTPAPSDIRPLNAFLDKLRLPDDERERRKRGLYATGLETGNGTIVHTALNTVFLRQHNRLCDMLKREHTGWSDDRLFETARAINIATVLRLVVTDYINHIANLPFKFQFDIGFAEREQWYRANRVSLEFNLLYRWHSMTPDQFILPDGEVLGPQAFSMNNAILEKHGPARLITAASGQRGGRFGLRNTPDFLMEVEEVTFLEARKRRVQPYARYRAHFQAGDPVRSFEDLTDDPKLAADLKSLYRGRVDRVDFVVGLMAERRGATALFGPLMFAMVGSDAFSHILTNPLLASGVFREAFPGRCAALASSVQSLEQLVRETAHPDELDPDVPVRASFGFLKGGPVPRAAPALGEPKLAA